MTTLLATRPSIKTRKPTNIASEVSPTLAVALANLESKLAKLGNARPVATLPVKPVINVVPVAEPVAVESVPALPVFDITRDEVTVTIANPATGGVRCFRTECPERGALAGKRFVSVLVNDETPEDGFSWKGFAWIDSYGLTVWNRFVGNPTFTGPSGYVALLTESHRFAHKLEYSVSPR